MNARRVPVLLSWSGGKDAAWVLHVLRSSDDYEVVGLMTTFNSGVDQAAGQGIAYADIAAQADALGLPLFEMWIPERANNAEYTQAFASALSNAREVIPGLASIAFGDISLADLKAWRTQLCEGLGMTAVFPLFGIESNTLAREMIGSGLKATLTRVDEDRLPAEFLGMAFDEALLQRLPANIDPCGENGEFQTQVSTDGLPFTQNHRDT